MAFKAFFFIMVELPSIIMMTAHKIICSVANKPMNLLPIWQYRLLGISVLLATVVIGIAITA